jgi:cytochrome c1
MAAVVLALAPLAAGCREDAGPRRTVAGGDAAHGRRAAAAYGCGGCHVIPDVPGARGRAGPPLTDFGDRTYVGGRLPNTPATLARWIREPQRISPGTVMPDLSVTEADARDIAAYLLSLSAGGLGPPHLLPQNVIGSR